VPLAALEAGCHFPELRATVSAAANERYWRAAGIDHPRFAAGTLYPPLAANLTILSFLQVCSEAMIQTRQRLQCHRAADADVELVVHGEITERYAKRGREYVDVRAEISAEGTLLWTSEVTFTPVATLGAS
jgi:hypothetical protein